jgi:dienelactone hydrolase
MNAMTLRLTVCALTAAAVLLFAEMPGPLRAADGSTASPANGAAACPYPTAHDAPLDAKQELVENADDYTLYRVEFNGIEKNSRVPAYLYLPKNAKFKAPYPAIMLQYGTGGNKKTNYIVEIGKLAVRKGLAVLTIDAPDRGERKGKEPDKLSFLDGRMFQYMGDYSRAADFLTAREDVDAKRIGYVGISWGAITGVTFAAHDRRIACVASLVGGGNFAALIPGGAPDDVVAATKQYDPYYHVALIAPRPLLLVNVLKDQLVPRIMSESLQKAAPEYAKRVWLNADHFFNGVDRVVEANRVLDWVGENLAKRQ